MEECTSQEAVRAFIGEVYDHASLSVYVLVQEKIKIFFVTYVLVT